LPLWVMVPNKRFSRLYGGEPLNRG